MLNALAEEFFQSVPVPIEVLLARLSGAAIRCGVKSFGIEEPATTLPA
jgi:hypothetical protein